MLKMRTMINFPRLFEGSWRFERIIKKTFPDPLAFEGQAHFVEKEELNFYEESGVYTLREQQINFTGSYLYQFVHKTHCRVLFSNHQPFYELTQSAQTIEHLCGQDHYKGHFEAFSENHWTLNWHISGPRKKNIEIMTCYFRAS